MTYDEQIALLKEKKLSFINEEKAIVFLKEFSYYSLVSGYKDIFKIERNGNYRSDSCFEDMVNLYYLDDYLRNIFLHRIISIEKHIKSLYSYHFCETYGDKQNDYLNVTNYNYKKYQCEINTCVSIIKNNIDNSSKYKYIEHYKKKHDTIPLWVIIQTLTFGNLSKLFSFSRQELQSKIARNFKDVYGNQLSSMLNVLSKFRNVCAHGERLYNFKTKSSIIDLPIHKTLPDYCSKSKNDLFNVCICLKYLLPQRDFSNFTTDLSTIVTTSFNHLNDYYRHQILKEMGFPDDWEELLK